MAYDEMKRVAETHRCGECGSLLTVAWGGSFGINSYILRCSKDTNHNTINRHNKEVEKAQKQTKEIYKLDSKSLMVMPEAQMMQRVEMAKFPQALTPPEKRLLAQVAITYGFDPLMGEITIYQSRPYVSIDGRYRKAQETDLFNGVETRPANKQERTEWDIPEGDYFYHSEVWVKGASHPFVGWGRVYSAETSGGKGFKPIEKNPQRMAEKRAEAQALRKAFHIPLPSVEEAGSPTDEYAGKVHYEIQSDETEIPPTEELKPEVICPIHNVPLVERTNKEGGKFWSHRVEGTANDWCNGEVVKTAKPKAQPKEAPKSNDDVPF